MSRTILNRLTKLETIVNPPLLNCDIESLVLMESKRVDVHEWQMRRKGRITLEEFVASSM